MASLNQRDAGRDFEGNGPSSFDRRDYRIEAADIAPVSEAHQAILDHVAKLDAAMRGPVKLRAAA